MSFQQEYVRCGKTGCKSCPHGPYWYEYWREGKKTKKRYWGKSLPRTPQDDQGPSAAPHPHDAIFGRSTASFALACAILGFTGREEREAAVSAWRRLAMANHPDRGGDDRTFRRMGTAWSYYCAVRGWHG